MCLGGGDAAALQANAGCWQHGHCGFGPDVRGCVCSRVQLGCGRLGCAWGAAAWGAAVGGVVGLGSWAVCDSWTVARAVYNWGDSSDDMGCWVGDGVWLWAATG